MKYRKKPVAVEAIQWTGLNVDEICKFTECKDIEFEPHDPECRQEAYTLDMSMSLEENLSIMAQSGYDICLFIKTLEGKMLAPKNSYIVKGVKGEFYACRGDIFEETYEPVEEG